MLSLNDPAWRSLKHAYGSAESIPRLIQQLRANPTGDLWSELWLCICHQYSVYTATYAAVPHILSIARSLPIGRRFEPLHLLGTITAYHEETALLDDYRADYLAMTSEAPDLCLDEIAARPKSRESVIYLLSSLAGLSGYTGLARSFGGFACDEFSIQCPVCETFLYIWPSNEGYRVYAEDPVTQPQAAYQTVINKNGPPVSWEIASTDVNEKNSSAWLASLAHSAGYPDLALLIHQLGGHSACPSCQTQFAVYDEIILQAV
jgi:uncharacterized protein YbaR (Trm112 family)